MRIAGPGHTPAQLAKVAYRKHVRLARLEGGALGLGGAFVAPDVVALIWIQSRMIFYIAAAPTGTTRATRCGRRSCSPSRASTRLRRARAALDGVGKRLAQAMVEKAISHRSMDSLHRRLVKYLLKRLARRYAARWIPLIGAPLGALQNGRVTEAGRPARALVLARRATRPGSRRPSSGSSRRDEEAHDLCDRRRLHPLRVVGVRHRLTIRRRVDDARQDRVAADSVRLVVGVERADERQHRRLPRDVAGRARERRTDCADTPTKAPSPRSIIRGIPARAS